MPKLTCLFSLATLGTLATFALPLAAQDAPRINEIIVVGVQDSHTVATGRHAGRAGRHRPDAAQDARRQSEQEWRTDRHCPVSRHVRMPDHGR